ncbi:MAG: GNAT family N-acetyltransferase [Acidimicrobiia bacterium]|nr:GNAT family N-acetyltransferase [Acidimicrobiia bacterium]
MQSPVDIVSVDQENLHERGFFCRKSKMKTVGNQRKLAWTGDRFAEGLGIDIVYDEGRSVGFIEYAPGEHSWRVVEADGYLLIHCIWVVGRAKGKGYGTRLLEGVEAAAVQQGRSGVAMVVSRGNWLADGKLLAKHGYTVMDEAPPAFRLMAKPLNGGTLPSFPTDWEQRAAAFGDGLTIVTTDQCPYLDDAEQAIVAGAETAGLTARIVKLESAAEVRRRSPSAFGVFGVVLDGELLSYHYLLEKDVAALLADRG